MVLRDHHHMIIETSMIAVEMTVGMSRLGLMITLIDSLTTGCQLGHEDLTQQQVLEVLTQDHLTLLGLEVQIQEDNMDAVVLIVGSDGLIVRVDMIAQLVEDLMERIDMSDLTPDRVTISNMTDHHQGKVHLMIGHLQDRVLLRLIQVKKISYEFSVYVSMTTPCYIRFHHFNNLYF